MVSGERGLWGFPCPAWRSVLCQRMALILHRAQVTNSFFQLLLRIMSAPATLQGAFWMFFCQEINRRAVLSHSCLCRLCYSHW